MQIAIAPYPERGADYEHLSPVANFLLQHGHQSNNDFIWGNNRTGFFCHLKGDIDFSRLRKKFLFPDSIRIDEKNQTIDCLNTYSVIKGGF